MQPAQVARIAQQLVSPIAQNPVQHVIDLFTMHITAENRTGAPLTACTHNALAHVAERNSGSAQTSRILRPILFTIAASLQRENCYIFQAWIFPGFFSRGARDRACGAAKRGQRCMSGLFKAAPNASIQYCNKYQQQTESRSSLSATRDDAKAGLVKSIEGLRAFALRLMQQSCSGSRWS